MVHVEAEYRYVEHRREHEITLWYVGTHWGGDWVAICGITLEDCFAETARFCKHSYLRIVKMDYFR